MFLLLSPKEWSQAAAYRFFRMPQAWSKAGHDGEVRGAESGGRGVHGTEAHRVLREQFPLDLLKFRF